tara:strand:- start:10106 stop:10936 length:831 start_codon:yes stop_codon:yes gene_type:complete
MQIELNEIADGIFALIPEFAIRFNCNIGIILEDDGITLVDTGGTASVVAPLLRHLEAFNRPVKRVILTHGLGDHTCGASKFSSADIYCSPDCAASLKAPQMTGFLKALHPSIAHELEDVIHPAPSVLVEDEIQIGSRLSLQKLIGHTKGDLIVRVDDADLVFAGDLCFFGHKPLGLGADFSAWRSSLDTIKGLNLRHVSPGHGPIGGHSEIDMVASYLDALLEAKSADHLSLDQTWSKWFDPWDERISGAIDRINIETLRNPGSVPPTLFQLMSES